tara:strand:+ start:930 stop:1340 length:411 start_codon:yes stop_codon:yes gene_type:complete
MKKLNSSEIEFVVKEILNEVSENIINNKEVEFSNNKLGKELVEDYKDIRIREENLLKLKDRVRDKEIKLKEIYNIKVNRDFNRYDEFEIEKGKIYSLRGNVYYKIKEEISRKVMLENLKGNNIEDLISSLVKEFSS